VSNMSENQNGWNEYSRLVLNELEKLNESIQNLQREMQDVKKELTELKAKEDKVNELRSWKKDLDEVVSPTQLKDYIKDINDLKSFKTVAVTVWAIVQFLTAVGIAVARYMK
jgi:predicted  nucleic acid-binding Zn-ribbon protein